MAPPQTTAEAWSKTFKDEGKYWGVDANNQRIYWARPYRAGQPSRAEVAANQGTGIKNMATWTKVAEPVLRYKGGLCDAFANNLCVAGGEVTAMCAAVSHENGPRRYAIWFENVENQGASIVSLPYDVSGYNRPGSRIGPQKVEARVHGGRLKLFVLDFTGDSVRDLYVYDTGYQHVG